MHCFLATTLSLLLLAATRHQTVSAFAPVTANNRHRPVVLATTTTRIFSSNLGDRNPDKPELPVIPGDYDWDAKFSGDADWLALNKGGDNVPPGKRVLNEIELASQVTALGSLEEKWRKERIESEYEASINIGWVPTAEMANGRFAMFFLVTGLLTEYWTGISLPGQVEELLRVSGIIGF